MNKTGNTYLETDPYKIIEKGFHKDEAKVSESLFSLGNEYMGIRGSFDEGISHIDTLRGSYFNGVYEYAKEDTPSAYKGIVKRTHFMINSVDWTDCLIEADGEKLDLGQVKFEDFNRELDMKSGLLTREFTWILHDGKKIKLAFKRFISMSSCQLAFQQIDFELIEGSNCLLNLSLALNSNVLHWGSDCYWRSWLSLNDSDLTFLGAKTPTTNQKLVCGMSISSSLPYLSLTSSNKKLFMSRDYKFELEANKPLTVTRQIAVIIDKAGLKNSNKMVNEARLSLKGNPSLNYEKQLEDNKKFWSGFYRKSDIVISGDEKDQQGIRFCLFQLTQTYHGYSASDNIGAKGLTGEAYSGHAFWDSETYCLPFYLLTNMKAAKDLLMFRYSTLAQAKKRAKDLDCQGACYPIATLNGEEGCNLWQHASLQFQPSTGVAYAIFHYYNLTKDSKFIADYGLEMLLEISHFLLDRGQYNASKTKFGYYGVMGPDEFKMMVNNNAYTNFMAKKTFLFTIKMYELYGNTTYLVRCGLDEEFIQKIKKAADDMELKYDSKTMLFEQNDGFFALPHLDLNSIPNEDFPLYSHWTYDRIYRYDMIKQPDVLMFMFLYSSEFSLSMKEANYDYYEPRCIHESSLSPSIHSIFASELGKKEEALKFFSYATRLDLDDYNNNTSEGLHTTSLAAAFMNIVYGFGGVRTDGEILSINPHLPDKWNSFSFKITYFGRVISILVNRKSVTILNEGDQLSVELMGKKVLLKKQIPLIEEL